jgi:hypothetical protein
VAAIRQLPNGVKTGQVIRMRGRCVRVDVYALGEIGGCSKVMQLVRAIRDGVAKAQVVYNRRGLKPWGHVREAESPSACETST